MRKNNFSVLIIMLVLCSVLIQQTAFAHERIRDYENMNPEKDFSLTDYDGNTFHLKDHRDKIILLFFGYLSCPDVCPVTLSKINRMSRLLNESEGQEILTVFISVDPDRDSLQEIKEYLSYFGIQSVGLTGSQLAVDYVVESFKGWYEKVGSESATGYLINHTSYIYLIDHTGSVKYLFRPEDSTEHMVEIFRDIKKMKM